MNSRIGGVSRMVARLITERKSTAQHQFETPVLAPLSSAGCNLGGSSLITILMM